MLPRIADPRAVAEARAYLTARSDGVNRVLRAFWQRKREEWSEFPEIVTRAFDAYDLMTADGKKIRAGLVCLGCDAAQHSASPRSTNADGILHAAGAVEILHNAFLIHDDIVDRADLRRNHPTVHRHYAAAARDGFATVEEAQAYGRAVALNFGDKGQALAQELLLSAGFPDDVLLAAIRLLSKVTAETVAGQLLDVVTTRLPQLTREEVLRIHEYKTAHYTVMLPLLLGATLAAADNQVCAALRRYAIPVGIAFQLQDDILGLFGNQDELGKPIDSDLKEGKKTLLFVDAYAAASPLQREFLERVHGNPELSVEELRRVRAIVRETGALARSEDLARRLVAEGQRAVSMVTGDPRWRHALNGLADHLILRSN